MRKIVLLTIAVLMVVLNVNAENVPYAEYKNGTLTFKYGDIESSSCQFVWNCESTYGTQAPWNDIRASVEKVEFNSSFRNARPKSCAYWFYMFKALKAIYGIKYLNTSECTSMSNMFKSCILLDSIDVSYFNTLKVTNMSQMFAHCAKLKTIDLRSFGIDNVTNMDNMFLECDALTTIYCNEAWTCSSSTNMFSNCIRLKGAVMYDANNSNVSYANPTTGYFTKKAYDLWIAGEQVETSTNLPNVSGTLSGIVRYTPSTKTLTLYNANITYNGYTDAAIRSEIDGLNIRLVERNVVTSSNSAYAIALNKGEVTFSGTGTLEASGVSGIQVINGTGLNIVDGAQVTAQGQQWGIRSSDNRLFLNLKGKNVMLKAKGETLGSIVGINNTNEYFGDSIYIHEPENAYIEDNSIYANGNLCRDWVKIAYGKPVPTVRRIDITDYTWPTDYEAADYEASTSTKGCKVTDIEYIMNRKTLDYTKPEEVRAGEKVGVMFTVELEEGYEFAGNNTAYIECNGELLPQDEKYVGLKNNQKRFLWIYPIPTPEGGAYMRTAEDTITAPVPGKEPVWEIAAEAGAKAAYGMPIVNAKEQYQRYCPVSRINWYELDTNGGKTSMSRGDKFKSGKMYLVEMAISPVDGKQFHSRTTYKVNGVEASKTAPSLTKVGAYYYVANSQSMLCYVFPSTSGKTGDANGDGFVTMADANLVVNYFLAAEKSAIDINIDAANVNGDDDITMADANQIVNMFLSGNSEQ